MLTLLLRSTFHTDGDFTDQLKTFFADVRARRNGDMIPRHIHGDRSQEFARSQSLITRE